MVGALLSQYLKTAANQGWSGSIHVGRNGDLLGQVIFVEGKVAWAVCRSQNETLGVFLTRLGYVTAAQLEVVQSIFKAHGGQKKLGAILEECGFTSRAVLRRGLQLHTRAAIESLSALPDARIVQVPGTPAQNEEVLFNLEEVLPQDSSPVEEPRAWRLWQELGPENEVLEPLTSLPGYLGSGIASTEGGLFTAHVVTPDVDPMAISAHLASVLDQASRGMLGRPDTLCMRAGESWVWCRALNEEAFVAVFCRGVAKPEIAQFVIESCFDEMRIWLEAGSKDRFRDLLRNMVQKSDSDDAALEAVELALRERLRQARAGRASAEQVERYEGALELIRHRNLEAVVSLLA